MKIGFVNVALRMDMRRMLRMREFIADAYCTPTGELDLAKLGPAWEEQGRVLRVSG